MTLAGGRTRRRPNRRVLWALSALGAVIVFALGVGLGQAVEENRGGGETQTSIRTLEPETLPAQTVTVTVSSP